MTDERRYRTRVRRRLSALGGDRFRAFGRDRLPVSGRERLVAVVFGDRVGLALFLGSLVAFGLVWRVEFLITDSYSLANGLLALADGDMAMQIPAYGPGLDTPGTTAIDGSIYARNYGILVLSLPFLAAIQAIEAVADLRIALVGVWCLLVMSTFVVAGRVLDREHEATIAGASVALVLFAVNVVLGRAFPADMDHLVALQLSHMVAGGFVTVVTYRLVASFENRHVGAVAGGLVLLGTPLSLWATVPKRHVITAVVVLVVALVLTRSRDVEIDVSRRYRAGMYALVGLLAWVHAPEALLLLVVLAVVDVPTAPSNDLRTLTTIGVVTLLALVPFFVTNLLLDGHPLKPPRLIADSTIPSGDISLAGAEVSSGSFVSLYELPLLGPILGAVMPYITEFTSPVTRLLGLIGNGLTVLVTDPERAYNAMIRSGYIERVADLSMWGATNLTLLESAPIVAGLAASIRPVVRAVRSFTSRRSLPKPSPVESFLGLFAVTLTLLYLEGLPIHAQVTVRYLYPVYPILVVFLVRCTPITEVVTNDWRTLLWTYATTVLIGGQFVFVGMFLLNPALSEAFQFHGLLAVTIGVVFAIWAFVGATSDAAGRVGAILLGIATAAGSLFVLFVAIEYYSLGNSHALPMMRALAEVVQIV